MSKKEFNLESLADGVSIDGHEGTVVRSLATVDGIELVVRISNVDLVSSARRVDASKVGLPVTSPPEPDRNTDEADAHRESYQNAAHATPEDVHVEGEEVNPLESDEDNDAEGDETR